MADVGVEAGTTQLALIPDSGLLTGAGTTYPVYIDPTWSTAGRTRWALTVGSTCGGQVCSMPRRRGAPPNG
ncbi:MAG: hypothetical protein ACRDT6_13630 [Micromonosporaceae bacterium]